MASTTPQIVVGVDESPAATRAAVWAIDEAISRQIPLCLLGGIESDVRRVAAAVQASGRPVTIRTAVTATPAQALLDASHTAAMVCVGDAAAAVPLLDSPLCPIAVVRGTGRGQVLAELDGTPHSAAVLQSAVAEARLRSAPLRVVGTGQARLDDRPSHWRQSYPDLDARPIRAALLDYLSGRADDVALVVLGAGNPSARAVLDHTDRTLLVLDRQRLM